MCLKVKVAKIEGFGLKKKVFAKSQLYDFGKKVLNLQNGNTNSILLMGSYKATIYSWVTSLRENTCTLG